MFSSMYLKVIKDGAERKVPVADLSATHSDGIENLKWSCEQFQVIKTVIIARCGSSLIRHTLTNCNCFLSFT